MTESTTLVGTRMPRFRSVRLVWIMIVALVAGAFVAQLPASVASAAGTASISGNVKGAPSMNLPNVYVSAVDSTGSYVANTNTDSSGNYSLTNLPAGSYTLRFRPSDSDNFVLEWWNHKTSEAAADYFDLTSGQSITGRNAVLAVGATISGNVKNTASTNLEAVYIYAYPTNDTYNYASFASTDASGNYTLKGLPAGTYTLDITPAYNTNYIEQWWDNQPSRPAATSIAVADQQVLTGKNAVLVAGGTVSGNLKGSPSVNLGDASVTAYLLGTNVNGTTAYTDANGNYQIVGLAGGSYTLQFKAQSSQNYVSEFWNDKAGIDTADYFSVVAGSPTTGKDAVLAVGASMSGNVTDASNANLAYVQVTTTSAGGDYFYTTTDTAGNYSFMGLRAGTYEINFEGPYGQSYISQSWNNKPEYVGDPIVVVAGATLTGKNAVLATGATISGNVKNAASANIPSVSVSVSQVDGSGFGSASTGADGNYVIYNLPAGTYKLNFSVLNGNYLGEWWNDKATYDLSDTIVVAAGAAVTGKDAVLATGATVSGNIKSAPSTNLSGASAALYDSTGSYVAGASTDASGNYTVTRVRAGTYTLYFDGGSGSTWAPEWWNNKSSMALADTFTVTAAQVVTGKDAVLSSGGTVSGAVTNSSAVGLGGVTIIAYKVGDGSFSQYATTDLTGAYTLPGLPAGDYVIEFSPDSNSAYLPQYWSGQSDPLSADHITVTAGMTTSGKNATLVAGTSISGTLSDTLGNPLNGQVLVYTGGGAADSVDTFVKSVSTTAGGSYTVPGLPTGSYKIGFTTNASGYSDTGALAPSDPYVAQWYSGKYSYGAAGVVSVPTLGASIVLNPTHLENPTFADVDPTSPFYTYVQWMSSTGISTGTVQPSGKPLYKPVDAVSRQAMALFLYRLSADTFVPPVDQTFADVPPASPFFTAVEWMANRGISTGTVQPSGKPLYKPVDPVSRQAMALFLARYDHVDVSTPPATQSFADVATNGFGAAAIGWMAQTGISTGTAQPSGLPLYKPVDPVSRQAMAAFLYRLAHLAS